MTQLRKIVSGGQTGVDRAALDVAIELGIPHGGSCPRGRRAEDGVIDERYQLEETSSPSYEQRTERNVVDSDGTLIVYRGEMTGGTRLTADLARRHEKPWHAVDLSQDGGAEAVSRVREWMRVSQVSVLNVAGPRASTSPGVYEEAAALLRQVFGTSEADNAAPQS